MRKGFTIAEVLVVIAGLSIMGLILTEIFFRSLRGGNKAQIVTTIKQNGQAALEQIDKGVREAETIICVSDDPIRDILVTYKNGVYTRYKFELADVENLAIWEDKPPLTQDDYNTACISYAPTERTALTDTNKKSGVALTEGTFTKSTLPGFKDFVTIEFKLGPGVEVPAALSGQIDPISFKTTIELR